MTLQSYHKSILLLLGSTILMEPIILGFQVLWALSSGHPWSLLKFHMKDAETWQGPMPKYKHIQTWFSKAIVRGSRPLIRKCTSFFLTSSSRLVAKKKKQVQCNPHPRRCKQTTQKKETVSILPKFWTIHLNFWETTKQNWEVHPLLSTSPATLRMRTTLQRQNYLRPLSKKMLLMWCDKKVHALKQSQGVSNTNTDCTFAIPSADLRNSTIWT